MPIILVLLPVLAAVLVLLLPAKFRSAVTITSVSALIICTFFALDTKSIVTLNETNRLIISLFDFGLLFYFAYVGFKVKKVQIWALALLQTALLLYIESILPHSELPDFVSDSLSSFMFFLVSIIGGIIVIFALKYIADDTDNEKERSRFIAILLAFLGVMNLLVQADNLVIFFTLFECTTLASFLLVRFRADTQSFENSERILWMNQIGGVAILIAVVFAVLQLDAFHWSSILNKENAKITLAPFAFLAIAAMIKGAQPPFENWLLGAMVAPTPVSAILHSSTMVKIAPFMILKLAPVISHTVVGFLVGLIGAISFVSMSVLALRETPIKRVLAYSTIALLGLMITLASIGSTLSMIACLALAFFHAFGKALLFLEAGVLEKTFHLKTIDALDGLMSKSPLIASLFLVGFLSMSIPPFGVFIGKWLALESSSYNFIWLGAIAVGGSALTLLYFKVAAPICAQSQKQSVSVNKYYVYTTLSLAVLLFIFGLFYAPLLVDCFGKIVPLGTAITTDGLSLVIKQSRLEFWYIFAAIILFLGTTWFIKILPSLGLDIQKEYACGEKTKPVTAPFILLENIQIERFLVLSCLTIFAALIVAGVLGI